MRFLVFVLGLLLTSLGTLSAQVTVEVVLEQEQFLPGETLPAKVKIRNRSGQTLRLGREADWLTFAVESRDGFVVVKLDEAPVLGEFKLGSSEVATKVVDLAPYFVLTRPGRYNVIATVNIKDWDTQLASEPKGFDIITGAKLWSEVFGVPQPEGSTLPPEVRRYTLQQANYLKKQLRLYLRLTDESESRVFKVVAIGPLVALSQPESQLDRFSNLHVLYQSGPRTAIYTAINPNGDILRQATYDFAGTRPRLRLAEHGEIVVSGGARRQTATELAPSKEKKDEVGAPKQ